MSSTIHFAARRTCQRRLNFDPLAPATQGQLSTGADSTYLDDEETRAGCAGGPSSPSATRFAKPARTPRRSRVEQTRAVAWAVLLIVAGLSACTPSVCDRTRAHAARRVPAVVVQVTRRGFETTSD